MGKTWLERLRPHLAAWAIVGLVAAGTGAAASWRWEAWAWDHFDVVTPGVLYRSGQLTAAQLETAVSRFGIRTVVNFLRPGRDVEAERQVARRLGVDFLNLPMPGDGFGQEEQFRAALAAIDDPERRPVLVHCARGTCRTGAAVALYRYERNGWTVEDVSAEMRRQTYRPGWLAGYVYQMVKDRPFAEIFEPRATFDRNRPEPEGSDVG
jgi:protein tyrosine/serine phosphatase